jgi:uncharacterized protein (TIGR00369 family)
MTAPGHSDTCFVCGFLGVDVTVEGGRATAEVLPDERLTGPPGTVHGGLTAAVFDELLGAAVVSMTGGSMTAHLEIDYRRPWLLGRLGRFGASAEWVGERKLQATAELRDADGVLLAEGRGLWVVARGHVG